MLLAAVLMLILLVAAIVSTVGYRHIGVIIDAVYTYRMACLWGYIEDGEDIRFEDVVPNMAMYMALPLPQFRVKDKYDKVMHWYDALRGIDFSAEIELNSARLSRHPSSIGRAPDL